ncbi:PREDICTED: uncharacterized protein LOC109176415 [Ipomoea nil]|uniref:uncharacterized protein LOC109176415 n=1 Tax=Ipomoea nil TaxID=35883 RepID=UPI0009018CDF|nr:PREDICTED: uncharacterized protein LOC109176415 [Ipomoea nil]
MVRRIMILSPESELKRGSIYFLIPATSVLDKKKNKKIIHPATKNPSKKMMSMRVYHVNATVVGEKVSPDVVPPSEKKSFVTRYIYHDVLRLKDAEKLLDCVSVQSYISNSEKVVFLNERPITRPCRGYAKLCIIYDRAVQESFLFCSISLVMPEPGFGDDLFTPETVHEPTASISAGSASSFSAGGIECRILGSMLEPPEKYSLE